jgi:ferredoxin
VGVTGQPPPSVRLVVDPVACDGIGMCARLAPDLVELDMWGFPIVATEPLVRGEAEQARRAAAGCPRRALLLVPGAATPAGPSSRPAGSRA